MKNKILYLITACALAFVSITRAEEGGMGHYVPGEYLDFCGMPPSEPGLYAANYFVDYGNGTIGAGKELPLGGDLAAGAKVNLNAEIPVALVAYPLNLPDIILSSGIGVPWVWAKVDVTAIYNRNQFQISGAKQQTASGVGDIQVMPIMGVWTNGDFKIGGMLNVWAPSGNYDAGQLANPGLGYWTMEPMLAFSWLSTKFGTEFTIFPAVDFNSMNNYTSYQSGDIFHVDATLAQHLPLLDGIIGAGVSVDYLDQITGDSGSGARLGDFEAQSVSVGPTVSYVHPLGKTTLIVDGSWLPQVHTVNTPKGNYFWAKITLAF
jgi:hypothetical protein